jgi:histidine triad (HIT) family protein
MMECKICSNEFEKSTFFENDKIRIMLAPEPVNGAHVQIYTKEHFTIIEQLPDDLLEYLSQATNSMSMILFELFKAQGTNIIIQNGVAAGQNIPHFCINIISRRMDDGINVDWDMNKTTPEELEGIQKTLSANIGPPPKPRLTQDEMQQKQQGPVMLISDKEEPKEDDVKDDDKPKEKKVNYYLKSLERIP